MIQNSPADVRMPEPRFDPKMLLLRDEIRTYRRELPRLLAEGQEGRFALIKADRVISVWDTSSDALQAGCELYGMDVFLAQPIDGRDLTRPFPTAFDTQAN